MDNVSRFSQQQLRDLVAKCNDELEKRADTEVATDVSPESLQLKGYAMLASSQSREITADKAQEFVRLVSEGSEPASLKEPHIMSGLWKLPRARDTNEIMFEDNHPEMGGAAGGGGFQAHAGEDEQLGASAAPAPPEASGATALTSAQNDVVELLEPEEGQRLGECRLPPGLRSAEDHFEQLTPPDLKVSCKSFRVMLLCCHPTRQNHVRLVLSFIVYLVRA